MAEYCTRCHASKLTCDQRMGAPLEHDFDSFPGIIAVANHIDEMAAAGPDQTNTTMPLNGKNRRPRNASSSASGWRASSTSSTDRVPGRGLRRRMRGARARVTASAAGDPGQRQPRAPHADYASLAWSRSR